MFPRHPYHGHHAFPFLPKARGLSEELFVDHAKLHLTMGVLRLYGDAQIKAATALLRTCADEVRELLASKRCSK